MKFILSRVATEQTIDHAAPLIPTRQTSNAAIAFQFAHAHVTVACVGKQLRLTLLLSPFYSRNLIVYFRRAFYRLPVIFAPSFLLANRPTRETTSRIIDIKPMTYGL